MLQALPWSQDNVRCQKKVAFQEDWAWGANKSSVCLSRATKHGMELKKLQFSCRQQDQFLSSYCELWPRQHDDLWSNRDMRLGSFSGWWVRAKHGAKRIFFSCGSTLFRLTKKKLDNSNLEMVMSQC